MNEKKFLEIKTASAEDWKTLFFGDAMVVSAHEERILHLGAAYSRFTGFPEGELEGQDASILLHPEERDQVHGEIRAQLAQSRTAEITCRIRKKNGSYGWVRLFTRLVNDEKNGEISLNFLMDYDREMNSYKQVESMKQELHTLFDLIPGGAAKFDSGDSLKILDASDGYYALTGYSREEIQNAPFLGRTDSLILPEDRHAVQIGIEKAIENRITACVEYRIRKKDGAVAWNTAYIKSLPGEAGKGQLEGVFLETTESKTLNHRLSTIINSIEAGIAHLLLDREKRQLQVLYANEGFYRLIGKTAQEVADNSNILMRVVHQEDFSQVAEKAAYLFGENGPKSVYLEFRHAEGERYLRADLSMSPIDRQGVECVLTDITAWKLAELARKTTEERYRIICEGTQDIIFEWDIKRDRSYHSPMFLKKFGYEIPEGVSAEYILQGDAIHRADKNRCIEMLRMLKYGSPYAEAEYRIKKADGSYVWCRVRGTMIAGVDGTPSRALGIISDISNEKLKMELLKEQAQRDLLTGLYNAETIQVKMEELLRKSSDSNRHILMIFDVDGFQDIVHKQGRTFGDGILMKLAGEIQGKFRENDMIGRLGESRFVILLKNINDKTLIKQKVEVLQAVLQDLQIKGIDRITASVGISLYPQDGLGLGELMTKAEIAFQEARARGGGESVFYTDQMHPRARDFRPSYSHHTIEYSRPTFITTVLDILYHTEDQKQGIQLVLSWMGQHLQMEHIYVYEIIDNRELKMQFEYCGRTTLPFGDSSAMQEFNESLLREGESCGIVCVNRNTLEEELQLRLAAMGIDLLLQVPLYKEGRCRAIFGFCDSRTGISWNTEQIETCTFLAKVINAYLYFP